MFFLYCYFRPRLTNNCHMAFPVVFPAVIIEYYNIIITIK